MLITLSIIITTLISTVYTDSSHHTMPLVSPAEMAILQAMLSGGTHLSLKAHFLTHMPDVSHLAHILTHLNLSFNTLKVYNNDYYYYLKNHYCNDHVWLNTIKYVHTVCRLCTTTRYSRIATIITYCTYL